MDRKAVVPIGLLLLLRFPINYHTDAASPFIRGLEL